MAPTCWSACWRRTGARSRAGADAQPVGSNADQARYTFRDRKGGDPRRGGERGSPNGPAPGGQSRIRYPTQATRFRVKLPTGHGYVRAIASPAS